jgi:pre-mRNA-splicing helicase BRR2
MQGVFTGFKRFNPIQSHVLPYTLKSNGNMLVCAPTSAGKTNVALLAILKAIADARDEETGTIDYSNFKIVYIAPMKALVAEVTGNLENRLKILGITVKELTGDVHLSKSQIEQTQVIISTPEKWDIITRKTGERLFVEKVKLIIIDEIHLLSDSRGPVLESIIARTIRQGEAGQGHSRIVGLSATLPNYRDVGAVLRIGKEGVFYFGQNYRPIPLEQRYVGVTEKKGVRKMLMINEILYDKVMERVGSFQMIIFVHSRRDTVRTANYLKDRAFARNDLNRIMRPDSESKKIIEACVERETLNSKDLKELLPYGIGVHHAGLSRNDRDLVEQLFADRHFNILVSTATLAWGVNLPAHTVIIKGTQVYSPEAGRWVELSLQDVMQMLGRAGRPRFDTEGEGLILTGYEEVRYYLNLLNMQISLESQMLPALPDHLNA